MINKFTTVKVRRNRYNYEATVLRHYSVFMLWRYSIILWCCLTVIIKLFYYNILNKVTALFCYVLLLYDVQCYNIMLGWYCYSILSWSCLVVMLRCVSVVNVLLCYAAMMYVIGLRYCDIIVLIYSWIILTFSLCRED